MEENWSHCRMWMLNTLIKLIAESKISAFSKYYNLIFDQYNVILSIRQKGTIMVMVDLGFIVIEALIRLGRDED